MTISLLVLACLGKSFDCYAWMEQKDANDIQIRFDLEIFLSFSL